MAKSSMPFYKMASENIRLLDSDSYRSVFVQCPIVCSAPLLFAWAGEYTAFTGGLAVLQKIPTRAFVGPRTNRKQFDPY